MNTPKALAALEICRAMKNSNIRGTTYIIRIENFVKIGFTKFDSAKNRLADLQKACPFDFELVAEIRGGKELESCLHDLFSEWRVRDEWVQYSGEVSTFIQSLAHDNYSQLNFRDKPRRVEIAS